MSGIALSKRLKFLALSNFIYIPDCLFALLEQGRNAKKQEKILTDSVMEAQKIRMFYYL